MKALIKQIQMRKRKRKILKMWMERLRQNRLLVTKLHRLSKNRKKRGRITFVLGMETV